MTRTAYVSLTVLNPMLLLLHEKSASIGQVHFMLPTLPHLTEVI